MSIAGYPTDPGNEGRDQDGRATPAEPPPDDWNASFTAIVSGISGDMRWEASGKDLDQRAEQATRESTTRDRPDFPRAPDSIWADVAPDTADDRKLRRELRREEREAEFAAFHDAQAEREAAHAADTEHYEPPAPPPMPRFRRSSVVATLLIIAGLALIISPRLLPASLELVVVIGILMIFGGGWVLAQRLRHRHDGDNGAEV